MKKRRGVVWLVVVAALYGAAVGQDASVPAEPKATTQPVTEITDARGDKKYADKCTETKECGFDGAVCDGAPNNKQCQCQPQFPASNHLNMCGELREVNESCSFNEQCEMRVEQTECRDGRCSCLFDLAPEQSKDGSIKCTAQNEATDGSVKYIDPAMIGVLVGMALMFVIICVVLRLFSKARWRENRTIFNTPNPRLMNVSLLRDSKLLHGNEQRRGSRASVRAPSRQPSMASLRPHSPNGSPGSRRGSKGSNASAASTKSPSKHGNHTPVLENVTVEIQDPKV